MKRTLCLLFLLCIMTSFAGFAQAADWPNKPVTVIVPWAPGGMTDVSTRMLVEKFKEKLGQPVMVNNIGGAGGITGMRAVLSSQPDGYTFGSGAISSALAAPLLLKAEPFDLDKILFVGGYAVQVRIVWTSPDKPYKTWSEFVEYVKANPGKVSAGGGGSQVALDVFRSVAKSEGLSLNFVMFKSGGEASTSILGGHVDVCETGSGTPAYQAAREGKLIPLVCLSPQTDPVFPGLKTVAELGYPFSITSDYGMVLPKDVPESIRAKLEKALQETLEDKNVQETMSTMGLQGKFMTGKEFEASAKKSLEQIPKLTDYIKDFE